MNKLFTKIAALFLGMTMAVGVGVAVGTSNKASEVRADEASITIADYASAHNWSNDTAYSTIDIVTGITATANTNNGKYYTTDDTWRFYQNQSGKMTISISIGTLNSVTVTFGTKDSGKLYYESKTVTSGTAVTAVSGLTSATFSIGSSSGNKGKVNITQISVDYTASVTTYKLTYNENKPSGAGDVTGMPTPNPVTGIPATNSYVLSSTLPSLDGYICLGWGESTGATTPVSTVAIDDDKDVYAIWASKKTVTYHVELDDYTGVLPSPSEVAQGGSVTVPSLEQSGYIFDGWSTTSGGTVAYVGGATISNIQNDIELYDNWTVDPNTYLIWDNIGTSNTYGMPTDASTSESSELTDTNHNNLKFKVRNLKINEGYIIMYGNATNWGYYYNTSPIQGYITSVKVSYTGGLSEDAKVRLGLGSDSSSHLSSASIEEKCVKNGSLELTALESAQYSYFSIETTVSNKNAQLKSIVITYISGSVTTKYSVAYDANGGEGDVPVDTNSPYDENETVTVLGNIGETPLSYFGYTWNGWNTKADYSGTSYATGSTFTITEDTTLYAKWVAKNLTGLTAGETSPTTKIYEVGQTFDPTGLTIHAIFNTTEEDPTDITSQIQWPALEKGDRITGSFTIESTTVYITITGLTITEPDIISGHKYFVVSSDNKIFMAKNLNGSYVCNNSGSDSFMSTATLSTDEKYLTGIEGISSDTLEDYAWTLTKDNSGQFTFKNAGNKYFNIFNAGRFYIDSSTENFQLTKNITTGLYSILSKKTNTYLNIINDAFDTNSNTASTGYRFVEYKEFGTLDHIEIDEQNSKTGFFQYDTFAITNVKVIAYDTNGIPKPLSSGYTCTGYNTSNIGVQTVTVTYEGKTDTYNIEVIEKIHDVEISGEDVTENFTTNNSTVSTGTDVELTSGNITLYFSNINQVQAAFAQLAKGGNIQSGETEKAIKSVTFKDLRTTTSASSSFKVYGAVDYDSDWEEIYSASSLPTTAGTNYTITDEFTGKNYHYFKLENGSDRVLQFSGISVTCLGSTVFSNVNYNAQKAVLDYANDFNTELSKICVEYGKTNVTVLTNKWGELADKFDNWFNNGDKDLTPDEIVIAKGLFANADSVDKKVVPTADTLQDMLAKYDLIVHNYKLPDFLHEDEGTNREAVKAVVVDNPISIFGSTENTNAITIIVIVSVVSLTAIGGYFFLKKRREQN